MCYNLNILCFKHKKIKKEWCNISNFKKKKINLYSVILKKTEIDICKNNLIIFSIDNDLKYINYMITKDNFKKYLLIMRESLQKDNIELKDIQNILEKEIYSVYKTKVAQKRIPQILLNILVLENFLYSDNCIEYEVKQNIKNLDKIINDSRFNSWIITIKKNYNLLSWEYSNKIII